MYKRQLVLVVVKFSQKYFKTQQATLGVVNGQVEEVYAGHNVVKAFNQMCIRDRSAPVRPILPAKLFLPGRHPTGCSPAARQIGRASCRERV